MVKRSQAFSSPITRELLELVQREVELLSRGRTAAAMDGKLAHHATLLCCCFRSLLNPYYSTLK